MEIATSHKEPEILAWENSIDLTQVPKHIAIIMDGNRRWARKHSLKPRMGHWKGADVIDTIVSFCSKIGVKVLTVYAFSTENWNRSDEEVNTLIRLFEMYLSAKANKMIEENIRLETIGDLSKFPSSLLKIIRETKEKTHFCDKITLVLALNYGSRDEITRAIKKIIVDIEDEKISKEDLTENLVSGYLDSSEIIDPDLLIRTGGESRLSNFMLWQLSYTEVYITPTQWPDFTEKDLVMAIKTYQNRDRRFGE